MMDETRLLLRDADDDDDGLITQWRGRWDFLVCCALARDATRNEMDTEFRNLMTQTVPHSGTTFRAKRVPFDSSLFLTEEHKYRQ